MSPQYVYVQTPEVCRDTAGGGGQGEGDLYISPHSLCVWWSAQTCVGRKAKRFLFYSIFPSINFFLSLHPIQGHRAAGWQAEYTLDSSISSVHIQHLTRYACFWMSESTLKGLSRPDSNPGRSCCEVTVHTALPMYSPAKEMHWAQREANV